MYLEIRELKIRNFNFSRKWSTIVSDCTFSSSIRILIYQRVIIPVEIRFIFNEIIQMLHQKTANVTGNNRIATIKSVLHWFSMKHLLLHLHYISISSTANQWQKWTMNIFVFPTSFPYIFPISAKNRLPSPIAANPYHSNVESCSTLCSVVLVPMSSSNRRFTLRWFVLLALTSCQHVLAVSTQKIISFLRKLMWTRYWKLKFTKYFGLQRVNPSQNLRTTHIWVTSQIVNSAHVRWGPGDFYWIPEVQCSNYLSYFLCTPCKSGTEFTYLISLR